MNIEQLRAALRDAIGRQAINESERRAQAETIAPLAERSDDLSEGETRSLTEAGTELERLEGVQTELVEEVADLERQIGIYERAIAAVQTPGSPNINPGNPDVPNINRNEDPYAVAARDVARGETLDMALRAIETDIVMDDDAKGAAEVTVRQLGERAQRYVLGTGRPEYREAWAKHLLGRDNELTPEESTALLEARAVAIGTDAAGGYAVPFMLDPTIIDTGDGSVNPFRRLGRVERITTDSWNGVSSNGVTAAYAAEAAEAADGAPTFDQPSVAVHKAHVFVPFSVEAEGDFNGLASSVATMIATAKDDLEADKFAVGTGTGQPTGVSAALDGTGSDVNPATADTLAVADLRGLWAALPAKYRNRATWVMNATNIMAVQSFGNTGDADFTVALGADGVQRMLGKEVAEADSMVDQKIVLGDFSNYLIVERIGMSIELVPHLMGANRRPTGQRGFYAWWRNGADSVNDGAFRQLVDLAA